ncbi:TPA: hypothetical protein SLO27_000986 [Citrobacter freundii]|nr:hypothetical protein [Citrobacter freundii]EKU2182193.1 hypothetical protein [Citrobacter freundii]HCB1769650.1 hypothetical protein [Citrobacter freundii]HCJ7420216.1 hypothetical protein [Citrobacter freundii]HEJ0056488.1 hypothetical protein [Citrobacter freundii]
MLDYNCYNYSAPLYGEIVDKVGQDCGKSLAIEMNKAMAASPTSVDNLFL